VCQRLHEVCQQFSLGCGGIVSEGGVQANGRAAIEAEADRCQRAAAPREIDRRGRVLQRFRPEDFVLQIALAG
jgi:hypothetical protein